MKTLLRLVVLLLAAVGILRAQSPDGISVREFVPMLAYIFFDSVSPVIPDRYITFKTSEETEGFTDSTVPGGTLETYYHVLNVIGYRMRRYPQTRIRIKVGNSLHSFRQSSINTAREVLRQRGDAVYDYLIDVWGIDTARIQFLPTPEYPVDHYYRDSLRMSEEQRVEISSDNWEIVKPIVFTYTSSTLPFPVTTTHVDIFTLILFKFDSPEPGPLNDRIMKEYLHPTIREGMVIEITGHTDVVGLIDRNLKLSRQRAHMVEKSIRTGVKNVDLSTCTITATAVGEDMPLFDNTLPEGRYFNRSVRIVLVTLD